MIRTPMTGEELASAYMKAHNLFDEAKYYESLAYFDAFLDVRSRCHDHLESTLNGAGISNLCGRVSQLWCGIGATW